MNQENFIANNVVAGWHNQVKACHKLLSELSDDQLMKEIVPGKNRGIYLVGHLAAVHDRMIPLLGLGDHLFPAIHLIFLQSPDKAVENLPSIDELKNQLDQVNEKLNAHFATMNAAQWLEKHNSVSAEDFVKEPHRNKLSVLISRTNHLANHIGQLLLLR
jgi:hypothetical protein